MFGSFWASRIVTVWCLVRSHDAPDMNPWPLITRPLNFYPIFLLRSFNSMRSKRIHWKMLFCAWICLVKRSSESFHICQLGKGRWLALAEFSPWAGGAPSLWLRWRLSLRTGKRWMSSVWSVLFESNSSIQFTSINFSLCSCFVCLFSWLID